MPNKTLRPFNDASIQLPTGTAAHNLAGMLRPQKVQVLAIAVGLLLAAPIPTLALELGEASIKSSIGQSLLVEIPYRLAADERLTSTCIGLLPAVRDADALPTYTRVSRISVTSTHIEIFDDRGVREPLIGLNVDVHCSTAPHFVRSYQLFVDPPARIPAIRSTATQLAAARSEATLGGAAPVAMPNSSTTSTPTTRTPSDAAPRARGHAGGTLTQGQTYRVVRGDTLSGIAARVAERPATIRETADAIFAANSEAFIRGNRDLLKEGRSITIPTLTPAAATPPGLSAAEPLPAASEADLPAPSASPTVDPAPASTSDAQPLGAEEAVSVAAPDAIEPLAEVATVAERTAAPPVTATPNTLEPGALSPATAPRTSAWLTALLALGGIIVLSVPAAFLRRRKQHAAAQAFGTVEKSPPRRPVEIAGGIEVVEGVIARPFSNDKTAAKSTAAPELAADSGAASPAGLDGIARTLGPIHSVDLDVGAPIVMDEPRAVFEDRADASASGAAVGNETIDENAATARMPAEPPQSKPELVDQAMDDVQMTLTIVELDMLRQDYEAEHTLTQQTSQALREALADLKATKAARTATAETATLESPQLAESASPDSSGDTTTARVRMR